MVIRYASRLVALAMMASVPAFAVGGPRFVNPDGLFKPTTFSQITVVEGGKIVFISGQTARDEQAQIIGLGDVKMQTQQAIANLRIAVEAVGGSMNDIANVTTYVVKLQPENRLWIGAMVKEHFPRPPAHTLVGISALAAPGLLVEIEAIAVLD